MTNQGDLQQKFRKPDRLLEDDFNDILNKAILGTAISPSQLHPDQQRLQQCLAGNFDSALIPEIAPKLGLNTEKLLHIPEYYPATPLPQHSHLFVSPFGYLGVNTYLIETPNHLLIFDTGTDASPLIHSLSLQPNKQKHLFITHQHPDHIACIDPLAEITGPPLHPLPNQCYQYDNLTLSVLNVSGHFTPALAFLIEGLKNPVCIVGDAIFAGSIGKCQPEHYLTALNNIKQNIFTLPNNTILMPGHGPLTTIKKEKENNPFF